MLFSSYTFIFLFLPITLVVFYAIAKHHSFKAALSFLVFSSLVFYSYWNPAYLLLLLVSIGFNFLLGNRLREYREKSALIFSVSVNLGLIAYYKYFDFFVSSFNTISGNDHTLHQVILPLAISFFTFQQITYLVDAYKGLTEKYSFLDYCQFVTFFPQLIAGPIVHHHEMMPQFKKEKILANINLNLTFGITLFSLGLFKKVILADSVALFATPVFDTTQLGQSVTFFEAWIGASAYTLQLYFDFSGYSDMAIGLARMFGITVPINFNSPYKAKSIIDFWRRWHITLSRFLRNYVYIQLGGNRLGSRRRYANVFITMLLGGLWHGAGWTFVFWGALHGVYLMLNHLWRMLFKIEKYTELPKYFRFIYCLAAHTLTLLSVIIAWVVFRAESFTSAKSMLSSMFGLNGIAVPDSLQPIFEKIPGAIDLFNITFGHTFNNEFFSVPSAVIWIFSLAIICLLAPNSQNIMNNCNPVLETVQGPSWLSWRPSVSWAIVTSCISTFAILHLSQVSEFLYFQF